MAGRVGPALEAVWAGTVASAATAEATVLSVRARALLDQLNRASLAVDRYADSLESITAATRRLQAQWDQAQLVHRRALDTAERQSALDPAHHARLVAHLQADDALVLTGLESRHESGMAELRDAGAGSARAIDAAITAALPQAAGTTAAAVRPDLIGGLCFAEGAARALEARDRASAAASQWRQLGPDPDSSAVEQWLGAHATSSDLVRLMQSATVDGSEPSAHLRARVMAELARSKTFARQENSTIRYYERDSTELERATVGWLLEARHGVDDSLADDPAKPPVAYSQNVAGSYQPLLRVEELTGLVGAYAVGPDLTPGGMSPAASHADLMSGELEHLMTVVKAGADPQADILRIAYYNQSASAALTQLANQQDDYNANMWKALAEAKNLLWASRRDPLGVAESLLTSGTTRTPMDALVISVVRSHVARDQAEANEARDGELARTLDALIRVGSSCPTRPVGALLTDGAGLAPATSNQRRGA